MTYNKTLLQFSLSGSEANVNKNHFKNVKHFLTIKITKWRVGHNSEEMGRFEFGER